VTERIVQWGGLTARKQAVTPSAVASSVKRCRLHRMRRRNFC